MRHVGEIRNGRNAQDVVLRALQFAESEPKGPVYVWAQREITEEHLDPDKVPDVRPGEVWSPIEPIPLNKAGASISVRTSHETSAELSVLRPPHSRH